MSAGIRSLCAYILFAAALVSFALAAPQTTHANEKVLVFFFSGLCPPGRPDACAAKQQADSNISPKLPPGATMVSPILNDGSFRNQGELSQALAQIGGNKIVFIAFSAGNKALWEMVSRMTDQQKMQVKSMISLEAKYSGWTNSVAAVRKVNPKVDVREFGASQFGTNHDRMPGNGGIADAIGQIATAAQNDTVANLDPNVFKNQQQVQVQYNPNQQQQLQQQLNQFYRPNPAAQFSYLPMPAMNPQLQQAYQPAVTSPQQISSYVQSAPQQSSILTSSLLDISPLTTRVSSTGVTFTTVSIGQEDVVSIDTTSSPSVLAPRDIVSVVVNPQNTTPISGSTFTSPDLAANMPGGFTSGAQNNFIVATLQNIMRGVVGLLQGIVTAGSAR